MRVGDIVGTGGSWPGLGPGEFQPRRANWKHMCLDREETHNVASPFFEFSF